MEGALGLERSLKPTYAVIVFHSQKGYPEAQGTHKRGAIPASERGSVSWRKTGRLGSRRPDIY